MSSISQETWMQLTHLGAAGFALPIAVLVSSAFWLEGSARVALVWLGSLGPAVLCVVASKVAFAGWGLGSAPFDFTGISGHSMLASAIFPVLLGWLMVSGQGRGTANGVGVGLIVGVSLGCVVGCSRVAVGAHSWSEVGLGWLIGTVVGAITCREMLAARAVGPSLRLRLVLVPLFGVLAGISQTLAAHFPTRDWEVRVALELSGRDRPYQRRDLFRHLSR